MDRARRSRWARHGLVIVSVLLALVLAGSASARFAGARRAAAAVALAHGDRLAAEVGRRLGPPGASPEAALADVVAGLDGDGLRYVAILDPRGEVLHEAGRALPGGPPLAPAGLPRFHHDRAKLVVGLPPPGAPRPPPGAPPALLLEFVPPEADAVATAGTRDLVVGWLGALVLAIGAVVAWRIGRRAEVAEAALAEQRHLAALGELSAVLAHEIRNPLAALKGHAQLLEERLPPEGPERRAAERVVAGAVRLEHLTRDLLAFARDAPLELVDVDPVEVVAEAADGVAPERIDVHADGAPERWRLDPERLRQVLVNLLENAVDASPDEARVDVRVAGEGSALILEIRDRGPGLPAELRERLFEPFVTGKTRGTGLGLAVAQRIVQQHGGRLSASDHPEGGAVLRVSLPRVAAAPDSGGHPHEPPS